MIFIVSAAEEMDSFFTKSDPLQQTACISRCLFTTWNGGQVRDHQLFALCYLYQFVNDAGILPKMHTDFESLGKAHAHVKPIKDMLAQYTRTKLKNTLQRGLPGKEFAEIFLGLNRLPDWPNYRLSHWISYYAKKAKDLNNPLAYTFLANKASSLEEEERLRRQALDLYETHKENLTGEDKLDFASAQIDLALLLIDDLHKTDETTRQILIPLLENKGARIRMKANMAYNRIYRLLGDFSNREKYLKVALKSAGKVSDDMKKDPFFLEDLQQIYFSMGWVLENLGKADEAIDRYSGVWDHPEMFQDHARAHEAIGAIYHAQKNLEKAKEHYIQAQTPRALNNLAAIYWGENQDQKAMDAWKAAMDKGSAEAAISYVRANAYIDQKDDLWLTSMLDKGFEEELQEALESPKKSVETPSSSDLPPPSKDMPTSSSSSPTDALNPSATPEEKVKESASASSPLSQASFSSLPENTSDALRLKEERTRVWREKVQKFRTEKSQGRFQPRLDLPQSRGESKKVTPEIYNIAEHIFRCARIRRPSIAFADYGRFIEAIGGAFSMAPPKWQVVIPGINGHREQARYYDAPHDRHDPDNLFFDDPYVTNCLIKPLSKAGWDIDSLCL